MIRPKVGVCAVVQVEDKILLGKRAGSHEAGTWSPPGGHLEFGETWERCAQRELFEETGITGEGFYFLTATNDLMHEDGLHYVTIFMKVAKMSGEPKLLEPEKCEQWDWFPLDNLPSPLSTPMSNLFPKMERANLW